MIKVRKRGMGDAIGANAPAPTITVVTPAYIAIAAFAKHGSSLFALAGNALHRVRYLLSTGPFSCCVTGPTLAFPARVG